MTRHSMPFVERFLAHLTLKALATLPRLAVMDDRVGFRVAVDRTVWIRAEIAD
jgi:hypothetical protein